MAFFQNQNMIYSTKQSNVKYFSLTIDAFAGIYLRHLYELSLLKKEQAQVVLSDLQSSTKLLPCRQILNGVVAKSTMVDASLEKGDTTSKIKSTAFFISLGISETWLIVLVALIYLLGVQGITILIHLPLNNQIQKLNLEKLKDENLRNERLNFENKWNFFNNIRTTIAFFVSLTLLIFLTIT